MDGFEFSSNGFKFKTFITSIQAYYSGMHDGVINFATIYNLCIDIECLGRDRHAKKALDSLSSDELADENRVALADTFKQGNTFAFEKDGHTFYATAKSVNSEAEYQNFYEYPGRIVDTRLASVKYTAYIDVVEIDPKDVVVLSKYVGDGR